MLNLLVLSDEDLNARLIRAGTCIDKEFEVVRFFQHLLVGACHLILLSFAHGHLIGSASTLVFDLLDDLNAVLDVLHVRREPLIDVARILDPSPELIGVTDATAEVVLLIHPVPMLLDGVTVQPHQDLTYEASSVHL